MKTNVTFLALAFAAAATFTACGGKKGCRPCSSKTEAVQEQPAKKTFGEKEDYAI